MSFDEGDMIAVTAMTDEHWWKGLLLDDERQNNCQSFYSMILLKLMRVILGWEKIPLSDVPHMPGNGLFRRSLIKLP